MSRKKRAAYLISLVVVFVLVLPIVILYAIGYRFTNVSWFEIMGTGGIFVRAERSGVEVYLDGKIEKKTGIFQHNFLISGLKIGTHKILVKADGYSEWSKSVAVFAEKVTEINPYLVPQKVNLKLLPQYVTSDGSLLVSTSTADLKKIANKKINPEFTVVSKLFASSSTFLISTSSRALFTTADFDFADKKNLILKNKLALWQDNQGLSVQWLGDDDGVPYYFCFNEVCEKNKKIPIPEQISHFDFYPGKNNYVIVTLKDGIYVYEVDDRSSPQNKAVLIPGTSLDFRVSADGVLYIKDAGNIYIADL